VEKDNEEKLLRSVALQNAGSILAARQRAEQELLRAKAALEEKTEQLARSLSMMRATLESTTDGILVTDAQQRVTDFNTKFMELWRIPAGTLGATAQQPLTELIYPQVAEPEAARARFEEIATSCLPETLDVLELADGRVLEQLSRIQLVNQQNVGRVWSFRDITERRRVESILRDEARVLDVLNNTGVVLASKLDLQSLVQAVTDAATELSGAEFGAFFYRTTGPDGGSYLLYTLSGAPRAAFENLGQPRPTALFGPTFRGEPPIRSDDILKDPRYAQMGPGMPPGHLPVRSYLAVPVISRSGEVIGGLFFGHSRTGMFTARAERLIVGIAAQAAVGIDNARLYEAAQRSAEERQTLLDSERAARAAAEKMSALKDEFLANLSHELRTPLNAIVGWSQILKRGSQNEADLNKGLETIERNARVQTQLIEDLLDMSRILSGKVRLDVQPIQPTAFIEAAIETIRPAADAKEIRLEKILDHGAGPISGDPSRLQQVMWNLLSNAVKFTPKGGKIQVLLERVNSHIEISVADTGIGIETEFIPHVFERFRQADASTTRRYGGLGLGLSIVKHLVELHGGVVRAESGGEGQGTTFAVHLPLAAVHRNPHGEPRLHPKSPGPVSSAFKTTNLAGLKILVVDDEPDARDLIKRVLTDCAATVFTAGSAAEALRLFDAELPQVLVSDIGMPDVDGYELLRRIRLREQGRGTRIPAIALTAFARSEDRTRALRAGFLVHVAKPVEPSELVATVASITGRTGDGED
jgi:signal transduction histidine kinase/CheY-like chemotaxis protein